LLATPCGAIKIEQRRVQRTGERYRVDIRRWEKIPTVKWLRRAIEGHDRCAEDLIDSNGSVMIDRGGS
jgi:hypothetical protein